jgi:6,7-dimethyl-8-ribityllumazine synthase
MAGHLPKLTGSFQPNQKFINSYRIGICVAEWHIEITSSMLEACKSTLTSLGVLESQIEIVYVPGSFELPLAANYLISKGCDGVVCLGAIIKGETNHDMVIATSISNAILNLNIQTQKPIIMGVLTTNNSQQAVDRAGGKLGNKGEESAICLLKMLELIRS